MGNAQNTRPKCLGHGLLLFWLSRLLFARAGAGSSSGISMAFRCSGLAHSLLSRPLCSPHSLEPYSSPMPPSMLFVFAVSPSLVPQPCVPFPSLSNPPLSPPLSPLPRHSHPHHLSFSAILDARHFLPPPLPTTSPFLSHSFHTSRLLPLPIGMPFKAFVSTEVSTLKAPIATRSTPCDAA